MNTYSSAAYENLIKRLLFTFSQGKVRFRSPEQNVFSARTLSVSLVHGTFVHWDSIVNTLHIFVFQ